MIDTLEGALNFVLHFDAKMFAIVCEVWKCNESIAFIIIIYEW